MSASPQRSSRLSSAAAAPSAVAAQSSSPAAGSKRRADGGEAKSASTDTSTDTDASKMIDETAASSAPPAFTPSADAAPARSSSATAASTRKRAKHTHALEASASQTTIAPSSRWSTLYSDALHSILQFASLAELSRVMSVNRRWNAAVQMMPPIRAKSTMGGALALPCSKTRSGQHFVDRLRSRLARHVASFTKRIPSLTQLEVIAQCLPWLHHIWFKPAGLSTGLCAIILAFKDLRTLNLAGARLTAAESDALIVAVSQLSKLEKLWLGLSRVGISSVCFVPLTTLHSLHTLALQSDQSAESASDAQIAQLRALSTVTALFVWCHNSDPTFFTRMLQPGHAFKWTKLWHQNPDRPGQIAVTESLAPLIGSLPSLELLMITLQCSNLSFLSHLPHLTQLVLTVAVPVPASDLVTALSQCTQLRALYLQRCTHITNAHLEQLLPSFSHLDSMILSIFPLVNSLHCLATPALAASLRRVSLRAMPLLPCTPIEVAQLLGLRSLQVLDLHDLVALADAVKSEINARVPKPTIVVKP